jgi:hypothetical protein
MFTLNNNIYYNRCLTTDVITVGNDVVLCKYYIRLLASNYVSSKTSFVGNDVVLCKYYIRLLASNYVSSKTSFVGNDVDVLLLTSLLDYSRI